MNNESMKEALTLFFGLGMIFVGLVLCYLDIREHRKTMEGISAENPDKGIGYYLVYWLRPRQLILGVVLIFCGSLAVINFLGVI